MKRSLQDIDKLFRDGLEDHLESAPPRIWDAVNNDLDKKQALLFKQKYFRLKRVALVLLLFIFSSIACLLYFEKAGNKNTGITKSQQSSSTKNSSDDFDSPHKIKTEESATGKDANAKENTEVKHITAESDKTTEAGENLALKEQNIAARKEHTADAMKIKDDLTKDKAAQIRSAVVITRSGNSKTAASNSSKMQDNSSFVKDKINNGAAYNNNNNQLENNFKTTDHKTGNTQAAIIEKKRVVTELTPYLYQPPLSSAVIEPPKPGPFTAMKKPPFINRVTQNDSLIKAIAAAKKKAATKHTVSLMAFVSPNRSFTRLENDDKFSGPGRDKKVAERDERQGFSYSAGVLVNYGISKRIIIQSGIVFSSAKTNISPKVIYARPDNYGHTKYEFNCSSGYAYINPKSGTPPAIGDSIQLMGASSTISYIGVPVSLNYVWQRGRFLLKPGIGFSVNFLTGGKSATSFVNTARNKKEITPINGLKTAYVDGSLGFGAELMLNRKISIGIKPSLRMALTSINKNTPVKRYQDYLSLETGVKINL